MICYYCGCLSEEHEANYLQRPCLADNCDCENFLDKDGSTPSISEVPFIEERRDQELLEIEEHFHKYKKLSEENVKKAAEILSRENTEENRKKLSECFERFKETVTLLKYLNHQFVNLIINLAPTFNQIAVQ